jgi:hypothetical protein
VTRIRVHRSPLRQFLFGVAGLLLLVAAVDIVWAHRVTLEPETDDSGVLTSRGESRRRQDLLVGSAFLLAGGGLVAIALAGLLNPRPVAVVDDDGIRLRIAGPQRMLDIAWSEVAEVRSAREPGDGLRSRPVLLVRFRQPGYWPEEYWSARRDGPWLVVDTDSWTKPPEEVVVHARMALEAFHRPAPPEPAADDL